jgi:hypothetical protein
MCKCLFDDYITCEWQIATAIPNQDPVVFASTLFQTFTALKDRGLLTAFPVSVAGNGLQVNVTFADPPPDSQLAMKEGTSVLEVQVLVFVGGVGGLHF